MSLALAVAGVWALATLGIGGALTRLGPWYFGLSKPPWQPPGWLFAPAWTVIMAFAAVAAATGWDLAAAPGQRAPMAVLWPISHMASLMLLPYAAWVAFAAVLNRDIVRRNAPFAGRRAGAVLPSPNR
jgi:tryptophan-rich sensory protein